MTRVSGRTWSPLRTSVIALASAETIFVIAFAILMLQSTDPLGRAIGQGMVSLIAIPYCAFVIPGLTLGLLDRWLPAAMALLVLAMPAAFVAWRFA
jgi:uncharacterized membrane protein